MCASFLLAVQAAPGVPPFPPLLVAAIHTALKNFSRNEKGRACSPIEPAGRDLLR